MKTSEIVKNWKNLSGFVYDRITGNNKEKYSESDWEFIDSEGSKIMKDVGFDEVQAKVKKLLALNLLDKKVSFKDFEKIPTIWGNYYRTSIAVVGSEVGQSF